MNKPQILIIEDDNAIGNLISTTLETQHYQYRRPPACWRRPPAGPT